jgi:transcriptional regulator with XRE-family HTH domain
MNALNELALRIKKTREQLKLTQDDFGKKLGCCKSTIINYESGKRVPDARFLIDLAGKFGIGMDWLLMGRGEMTGPFPYYSTNGDRDIDIHGLLDHLRIPAVKLSIMAEYYRLKNIFKPLIDEFDQYRENQKKNNV